MPETHRPGLALEHRERVRMHVAQHGQVAGRRLQVLADRQHVDVVRAHVAHRGEDLLVGLAETHHQPGLGRDRREAPLEFPEQGQRVRVVGAGSRLPVQPRYRLEIVVHHVGRRLAEDRERALEPTAEVRHQNLDLRGR